MSMLLSLNEGLCVVAMLLPALLGLARLAYGGAVD